LVVGLEGNQLFIKGLVPGIPGGLLYIKKVGEMKKFVPLLEEAKEASSV